MAVPCSVVLLAAKYGGIPIQYLEPYFEGVSDSCDVLKPSRIFFRKLCLHVELKCFLFFFNGSSKFDLVYSIYDLESDAHDVRLCIIRLI